MKLGFVTNILTPYRMKFYSCLESHARKYDNSKIKVYAMTDSLPLRPWKYEMLKTPFTELLNGHKFFVGGHDIVFNYGTIRKLSRENYDVLILAGSWTYPTVLIASLLKKRFLKNTKLLFWYESHDNAAPEFRAKSINNKLFKNAKRMVMQCFDGFCVPGDLAKESAMKFVSDKPFVYLRNAVDGEYYYEANKLRTKKDELRVKYGIDSSSISIIIPARLIKLKGIEDMLSRISDEILNNYNIEFVFAGEGDERQNIEKTAKERGIKALFLGYQNQENIRELLAASDFFCLSSLTDANPLSAIEAAWAGLPLLLSKYTGNYPELIEEGINGYIFDPLDEKSINNMLLNVFSKDNAWREVASNTSVRIARDKFDIGSITVDFLEQVQKICKN